MSNVNNPQPPKKEPSQVGQIAVALGRFMLRDWPTKLLSLVLALCVWAFVMAQDETLSRVRDFTNVKVDIDSLSTLKSRYLIVTNDVQSQLDKVSLRVNVPQTQYQSALASNYKLRLDTRALAEITAPGTYQVQITATNQAENVVDISPRTVELVVEDYIKRTVPVKPVKEGELADGLYVTDILWNPETVQVSGAKSRVERVANVCVAFDQSGIHEETQGADSRTLSIRLCDANGNELLDDAGKPLISSLEVTKENSIRPVDSVILSYHVYSTRSLPVAVSCSGEPREGYALKEVVTTPAQVLVAGYQRDLELLSEVFCDETLSIDGCAESRADTIALKKPESVVVLTPESVRVEAVIDAVIHEKTFEHLTVKPVGCPDNKTGQIEITDVTVVVSGPMLWVDQLNASAISLTCDLAGLEAGEYELEIQYTIENAPENQYSVEIMPGTLRVVIH